MIRLMNEKVDGLTAGVIASMNTMSSYTVNALWSFEQVVLVDTRRILDTSQLGLNATAESVFRSDLQQHGMILVRHGNNVGSYILV